MTFSIGQKVYRRCGRSFTPIGTVVDILSWHGRNLLWLDKKVGGKVVDAEKCFTEEAVAAAKAERAATLKLKREAAKAECAKARFDASFTAMVLSFLDSTPYAACEIADGMNHWPGPVGAALYRLQRMGLAEQVEGGWRKKVCSPSS